jgi:hypothetical protein
MSCPLHQVLLIIIVAVAAVLTTTTALADEEEEEEEEVLDVIMAIRLHFDLRRLLVKGRTMRRLEVEEEQQQ